MIPLLLIGTVNADAYIYGYLKDSGVAVGNGMATSEATGFYYKDSVTSSSTGYFWLDSDSGSTYTVESYKADYDRVKKTGQSHNSNAGTFTTDTRGHDNVTILVAWDDDTGVSESDAMDWIETAEEFFHDEHSINFLLSNDSSWTSNFAGTDCSSNLAEMKSDVNWSSGNYGTNDMVIGISDGAFSSGTACMNVTSGGVNPPTSGGNHPYILVDVGQSSNELRSLVHEISHAYGFGHVDSSCSGQIPGIMATAVNESACSSEYIVNLIPDDDVTIENRYGWY